MPDVNDAELVARAQNGNASAVGVLYDRHHERIFRYMWARVYDRQQAEDLTGEVFVRMLGKLSDYHTTQAPFEAWLFRIAHNLVVDHYRKATQTMLAPLYEADDISSETHNPAVTVEQQLTVEKVQKALETLDPAQREVVILRFLVGLSLNEVAQTLHKTVAAVKSLQHRGLTALRIVLQPE